MTSESSGPSVSGGCLWLVLLMVASGLFLIVDGVLVLSGITVIDDWFDDGGPPWGNIVTGSAMVGAAVVAWRVARSSGAETRYWQRIRREGVEGAAQVTECIAGGGSHNYQPVWLLQVTVSMPGREPFTTTRTLALPHDVASGLVGRTLKVRVDPNDVGKWLFSERLGLLEDPRGT